jgi:hypothetical protein
MLPLSSLHLVVSSLSGLMSPTRMRTSELTSQAPPRPTPANGPSGSIPFRQGWTSVATYLRTRAREPHREHWQSPAALTSTTGLVSPTHSAGSQRQRSHVEIHGLVAFRIQDIFLGASSGTTWSKFSSSGFVSPTRIRGDCGLRPLSADRLTVNKASL